MRLNKNGKDKSSAYLERAFEFLGKAKTEVIANDTLSCPCGVGILQELEKKKYYTVYHCMACPGEWYRVGDSSKLLSKEEFKELCE
ncbi:unnamed protein product [marine sediment metagenome]|uniref:Uncharacterized protein n=1 Tax=marine sediment metagenome TaxID=412755 RepID=X1ANG5_9ZZZZ